MNVRGYKHYIVSYMKYPHILHKKISSKGKL